MSSGTLHFEVYWTPDLTKKHKVWNPGFLTWNADNSRAVAYDEDRYRNLGESFIPGGPIVTRKYPMGQHLVEIIGPASDESSATPPATLAIAQAPLRPLRLSSSALPLAKRKPLHPNLSTPTASAAESSSANSQPVQAASRPTDVPIRRSRPPTQLAFRPPARVEPRTASEPQPAPAIASTSNLLPHPSPYPVYEFTDDVPLQSSTVRRPDAPNRADFNRNLFASTSTGASFPDYNFISPVAPYDPRIPPSLRAQDANHTLPSFDTLSVPESGWQAPQSAPQEIDIFDAPVSTKSSRVRTFETKCDNTVEASTARPRIAPPPLPPRGSGPPPKPSLPSTPKQSFQSASNFDNLNTATFSPFSSSRAETTNSSAPTHPNPTPRSKVSPATPKPSTATSSAPKRSTFNSPAIINPHEGILGFGTTQLCFPSSVTISKLPKIPRRSVELDVSFPNLNEYKKQYSSAILEEINHGLQPIASKFHSVRGKMGAGSGEPMTDAIKRAITTKFKQVYFDCTLISYPPAPSKQQQNRRHSGPKSSPSPSATISNIFYLKLSTNSSNQESNAAFNKDDVWILSSSPDFEPSRPNEFIFLASSTMHGKSSTVMEVKPLIEGSFGTGIKTKLPKLDGEIPVHAIHCSSIGTDLCMLDAVCDLSTEHMPQLPFILNGKPRPSQEPVLRLAPSVHTDLQQFIDDYHLNTDQAEVFRRVATWFQLPKANVPPQPIVLVHGVFGSGKSHMLVILIMFLCELLEKLGPAPGSSDEDQGMRILVSAATNTAVDRILVGLLEQGFTDFVRVGSLKRIDSRVLPYSIHREKRSSKETSFEENSAHSTGKSNIHADRSALRDLEELLHSRTLTSVERALIEQQKMEIESGSFERKIALVDRARVVGATCIATTFPILAASKFDIVILDECSQMPEPLSLLPAAKFGSSAFLLVGDPLQLPPQLKSRPKIDNQDQQGLGCALFSRLAQLGVPAVLLRTQYRLHPTLSSIANQLFYAGRLLNGVKEVDRKPLHPALPTLLFVECEGASQRTTYGGSIENPVEASIINVYLQKLVQMGLSGSQIGVICPYKNQVILLTDLITRACAHPDLEGLKEELLSIQISTVDAFQGAEKDLIVLSTCRTESLGFIDSPQRLNVSLTRGRNHLVIMGSASVLMSSAQWKVVLDTARSQGPRSFISSHSILGGDFFTDL